MKMHSFACVVLFGAVLGTQGANILHDIGVTCTSSSHVVWPHATYECEKAFDGSMEPGKTGSWASQNEKSGATLTLTLPQEYTLSTITIYSRCVDVDQFSGVDVEFSDGRKKSVDFPCDGVTGAITDEIFSQCSGQTANVINLDNVRSTFIKMKFKPICKQACEPNCHGGVREIEVNGHRNLLKDAGVSCTASSAVQLNGGTYSCDKAYDGSMEPGVSGAWASNKQDSGAYLEVTLPKKYTVTSVAVYSRCTIVDQYKGADLVFSDGTTKSMAFQCDGSTNPSGEPIANCAGQNKFEVAIAAKKTSSVRFNFKNSCKTGGHGGVREMEINGF